MKKAWQQPALEVLNVNLTMAGPGIAHPDDVQPDPDANEHDVVNYS
ncbi:paeninodin family lasso peptide [Paenibacillus sp. HB172176]|nr:paeninodin family lasso peptide [Paenibacillus sp. HB172176]